MKTIILALLLVMPTITIAQTQEKTVSINTESYHNRNCIGGTGVCSESTIAISNEKTTATAQKAGQNTMQITLEKQGFTTKEWEELVATKNFPVDKDSAVKIDEKLLKELSIDTKYNTIKPSRYLVTFKDDKAYFTLELETK